MNLKKKNIFVLFKWKEEVILGNFKLQKKTDVGKVIKLR